MSDTRIVVVHSFHRKSSAITVPYTHNWYADHVAALDEHDRRVHAEGLRRASVAPDAQPAKAGVQ